MNWLKVNKYSIIISIVLCIAISCVIWLSQIALRANAEQEKLTSEFTIEYNLDMKLYKYCIYRGDFKIRKHCTGYFKSVEETLFQIDLENEKNWNKVK